MYASSTGSTTSDPTTRHVVSSRRCRVVRLLRPRRNAPSFGFSLRGGREFDAGFFVTRVELGSEAMIQGLKVGDQVVSVNGYRVDDAVHSELVHYISSQPRIKLKLRHVGMVPIKDSPHEPLSWQFVSEQASVASDVSSSPTLCHDTQRLADMTVSILVPPRAKLGCGICKGPAWKPGIFVQFVRDGGIARQAGLRPGDQILACNRYDFSNISFNDAVSAMKVPGRLQLVVRAGAGCELVSPESSGYNSSASSAAGERSPALSHPTGHHLTSRLANANRHADCDRLSSYQQKSRTWTDGQDYWHSESQHNFDIPSDIEPDYDCPSNPNNPHTFESKAKHLVTRPSNKTVINLTEEGATIQCSYDDPSVKPSFTTSQTREHEKKTVIVEVHHTSNSIVCAKPQCNYPAQAKKDASDSSSMSSSTTLSSAIAEEIQRRKMLKKKPPEPPSLAAPPPPVRKPPPKNADDRTRHHDALIDEFKKLHRRMFAAQHDAKEDGDEQDRQPTLPLRKLDDPPQTAVINGASSSQDTSGHQVQNAHTPTNGYHNHVQKGPTVSNGHTQNGTLTNGHTQKYNTATNGYLPNKGPVVTNGTLQNGFSVSNGHQPTHKGPIANGNLQPSQKGSLANGCHQPPQNGSKANGHYHPQKGSIVNGNFQPSKGPLVTNGHHQKDANGSPPPPPPMPATNDFQNDNTKLPNQNNTDITKPFNHSNGSLTRTPTPDYTDDTTKKNDKAELQSIESYKLKNPANVLPKPPANYFVRAPNGPAIMKKPRPVSVTIGEYSCGNGFRKEPSKLEFLNGVNGDRIDGTQTEDVPITNRLQSELVMTLSRSNLRKKTEALAKIVDNGDVAGHDSDSGPDNIFHARYGNNIQPLPPSISIPKISNVKH